MRFTLFLLMLPAIALAAPTPGPTPSRADLLATVDHIQRLAQDAEANLAKEKDLHLQTANALTVTSKQLVDLQTRVNDVTDKANEYSAKYSAAEKSLWWYRLHWWGAWIMLGLGVLACAIVAFLKFTGKLAVAGAAVAAKVP